MKSYLFLLPLAILYSCQSEEIDSEPYNFYHSSNYYVADSTFHYNSKADGYEKDFRFETEYPPENFARIEEEGFLNAKGYDYYIIIYKNYFFERRSQLFSIKSLHDIVLFSHGNIELAGDDYMFIQQDIGKVIDDFSMTKFTRSISSDTANVIKDKIAQYCKEINLRKKEAAISENYFEILFFDGSKYYILNDHYHDDLSSLATFLLDSMFRVSSKYGYPVDTLKKIWYRVVFCTGFILLFYQAQ